MALLAAPNAPATAQEPADTVHADSVAGPASEDSVPAVDGRRAPPDTVPERVPGYRSTLRYLRSLRPRPDTGAREGAGPPVGPGLLDLDLVVNETLSPTGQRYFDEFYGAWEAPDGAGSYTIRVKEELVEGLYTRVVIELDGEDLLAIPVEPRDAYIEEVARQTVIYLREQLRRRVPPPGER